MNTNEFKFYCSHCDQPLKCEPQFAGRQLQCPACKHLIRIPNPPAGTGFTQVQPESGHTWDTYRRDNGCALRAAGLSATPSTNIPA